MSDAMNEIAKALASDMPRRKVFKLALGGVAASIGATLAGVVKPIVARADTGAETTIAVDPAWGYYGGTTNLSAELSALSVNGVMINSTTPLGLSGQQLHFFFNQGNGNLLNQGTAITNSNGVASISDASLLGINAGAYDYGIDVNYAGKFRRVLINSTHPHYELIRIYGRSSGEGQLTVYPADTAVSVNTATGIYGGSVDLSAELQSQVNGALPPNNQILDFWLLENSSGGAASTNINGVATLQDVSLAGISAGTYAPGFAVNYAGNNNYNWSLNYGTLVINQAPTSLTVNPVNGLPGGRVNLQAQLTAYINAGYQPLDNHTIQFFLLNNHVGYNQTNFEGIADLMNVSLSGIAPGVYMNGVVADYVSRGNYESAQGANTVTIFTPHTVVPLYNENAGFRRPYWALIRLYVANGQGQNVSSRTLKVTSVTLTREGGDSIPFAYHFNFDSRLVPGGGYQLLINTRYLELGTYTLTIHVDDDPTLYSVQFVLY